MMGTIRHIQHFNSDLLRSGFPRSGSTQERVMRGLPYGFPCCNCAAPIAVLFPAFRDSNQFPPHIGKFVSNSDERTGEVSVRRIVSNTASVQYFALSANSKPVGRCGTETLLPPEIGRTDGNPPEFAAGRGSRDLRSKNRIASTLTPIFFATVANLHHFGSSPETYTLDYNPESSSFSLTGFFGPFPGRSASSSRQAPHADSD